jgi:hypothetical protein
VPVFGKEVYPLSPVKHWFLSSKLGDHSGETNLDRKNT